MPPLAPTPTSPGGPKQMPKWAWPVAIGGGLLIGFFLLRKGSEEYEEEQQEESPYPDTRKPGGGGGGGALPFDDSVLEAFGLTPPTSEFQGSGTGDGSSFDGGGGETAVTSDGTQTAHVQEVRSIFGTGPTQSYAQQAQSYFAPPVYNQPVFVGQNIPLPGSGSRNEQAVTTPTVSSGSRSNVAQ